MTIKRQYRELEEHPEYKGWFKHPSLEIWMSKTDDRVLTPNGFIEPSVGGEYKYFIRKHIHLLKTETFLIKPTSLVKLYSNHIDGVKFNNNIENLEWVTPANNLAHAYVSGLRKDNNPGVLIDLSDGSIKSFNTQRECAAYLNLSPSIITTWLKSDRSVPIKYKFAIRLLGDEGDVLTKDDIGKVGTNTPLPLVCTNGESTHYFVNKKGAKDFLNIGDKRLKTILRDQTKVNGYTIRHVNTYEEYTTAFLTDKSVEKNKSSKWFVRQGLIKRKESKRVLVINCLIGTETEYENTYVFADENNISSSELNRALLTKDTFREFKFIFLE